MRTLVALSIAVAACAPARPPSGAPKPASARRELTPDEQVEHVLSRLTFGPRPGDAERLKAFGVDRWIAAQLAPSNISDSVLNARLAALPLWPVPAAEIPSVALALSAANRPVGTQRVDTIKGANGAISLRISGTTFIMQLNGASQAQIAKVMFAEHSERQLNEIVTDFWENHFSVYAGKVPSSDAILIWDRDVIRPHALGKFRDLLGATAHSAEMMHYLDNHLSRANALNENYAREIMELHTLGVDGGYTQQDVVEVARAFTGWTLETKQSAPPKGPDGAPIRGNPSQRVFTFNAAAHDTNVKVVLGHVLRAGRGIEDGEDVLDILARHPSTAKYIASKLARRLVSDAPPPALVDRAAATFTRTDGDIAEVVRTIVTSPEFFSRAAFRAKTKTPFEFLVSARRVLETPADTTLQTASQLAGQGMPIFGRLTPDGWPDRGEAWLNSGTIMSRILYGADIAAGKAQPFSANDWRGWNALGDKTTPDQVDGILKLFGSTDERMRRTLVSYKYESAPRDGQGRLREMVAMMLGSPAFQQR
ncbi:MAG TPA: DUF1800 domain-containing protein [Gemmatimonadaceae bacterium]|nr:DUF1800 domain-containing protein [Gemmatimonadaceae bacterium]